MFRSLPHPFVCFSFLLLLLSFLWFIYSKVPQLSRSIKLMSRNRLYRHRRDSGVQLWVFISTDTNQQATPPHTHTHKKHVWSHSAQAAWGCVDRCLSGLFDISVPHPAAHVCVLRRDLGVWPALRSCIFTVSNLTTCVQRWIPRGRRRPRASRGRKAAQRRPCADPVSAMIYECVHGPRGRSAVPSAPAALTSDPKRELASWWINRGVTDSIRDRKMSTKHEV